MINIPAMKQHESRQSRYYQNGKGEFSMEQTERKLWISFIVIAMMSIMLTLTAQAKEVSGLGIGDISNPTTGNWNKVYFGSQSDPIRFNVLQVNETHFGGNTMLLDCETTISHTKAFDSSSNVWETSSIRSWLNGDFKKERFTKVEQSVIANSVKAVKAEGYDGHGWETGDASGNFLNFAPLTGDQIFLLDAKEASNTYYGFEDNKEYNDIGSPSKTRRKRNGWIDIWRLRSPYTGSVNLSGAVGYDGSFTDVWCYNQDIGVSPALNINMDSILFTSDASDGTYKLTVKDPDMTIQAGKSVKGAASITFEYSLDGAHAEDVNRVSVVMTDSSGGWDSEKGTWKDGTVLNSYDALVGELGESGSITIPENFDDTWRIYLVAEQVNEGNRTDYASEPVEVTDKYLSVTSDKNVKHGTILVNKQEAKYGETVTVTAVPEGTYSTSIAFAKEASGKPFRVEIYLRGENGAFTGTFKMPKYPVVVTTTFGGAGDDTPDEAAAKTKPVPKVKIKTKSKTIKACRLKKKARFFKIKYSKTKGSGKATFKRVSGSARLTVSKAGKIKVKKGTKKGTYKIRVKMSVAANKSYKTASTKKTIRVLVK